LIFLTPHGRHACDTRLRGGGVAIALGNGREAIRMLWDVLSQFWEVLSREWERRGERARFLKVVELPDKSRQKVSATRSAGSSVRCCPGSEMPHVISTQWPPFSSTTLDNIHDGEDVFILFSRRNLLRNSSKQVYFYCLRLWGLFGLRCPHALQNRSNTTANSEFRLRVGPSREKISLFASWSRILKAAEELQSSTTTSGLEVERTLP
jgi:hypothetical protein